MWCAGASVESPAQSPVQIFSPGARTDRFESCVCPRRYPCASCREYQHEVRVQHGGAQAAAFFGDDMLDGDEDGGPSRGPSSLSVLCVEAVAREAVRAGDAALPRIGKLQPAAKVAVLRELVRNCTLTDELLEALWDDEMQILDVRWCSKLTGTGLGKIGPRCANLRVVNVSGCKKMNGQGLLEIAKHAKGLRRLVLDGCAWHITDTHVQAFAQGCPELRGLNVSRCMKLTDAAFPGFRLLEEVHLNDCVNVTDRALENLATANPGLHTVSMYGCIKLTDGGIRALAKSVPLLRSFAAGHCPHVTDQSLSELSSGCRMLREVSLTWCRGITADAVAALAQNCKALRALTVMGCDKMTDAALEHVAAHCSRLSELNVSWCAKVTIDVLRKVRRQCQYMQLILYYRTHAHAQRALVSP